MLYVAYVPTYVYVSPEYGAITSISVQAENFCAVLGAGGEGVTEIVGVTEGVT